MREFTDLYRSETETLENTSELISKSDLAYIWDCSESMIDDYESRDESMPAQFEINTKSRMTHFLSQTAHEGGGGKWKEELSDSMCLRGRADLGHGMHEDQGLERCWLHPTNW